MTGASGGIGAATARSLASEGFHVICAARRKERIEALAKEISGRAIVCDVTSADSVRTLAEAVDRCDVLVNNAGGALGLDPVADADLNEWTRMYETNVLGAARVTQKLLSAVRDAHGMVVFITSTAAETAYEGGGGYCAAKSAERAMVGSLRLELVAEPIRVCEISPGLVATDEFSLVRFHGDAAKAAAVYEGVAEPLVADDIAECVRWIATLPAHVNIDRMVVRPRAQAANHKLHRE